ncbi:MAG TPA: FtsX-like permease family protein [Streptomyces sp.]|uniref:ABC transporter permease n=1 Tax=Streptomyces sp. TaxID=1931 RepID=UPI002D2A5808|nr:FtsX-like permease family protein [Streptomyces sp.]HZG03395.1 FtsX-like permease family protein [Streptomyces sp.]
MSALDSRRPPAPDRTPPPPSAPSPQPAGPARWAADLVLGARFALAGGREGWARTVLTAVGVGLGVAVLLVATSVPNMLGAREARAEARENYGISEEVKPSDRSALYLHADTEYRGENVRGRYLQPDGDRPPLPPGVEKLPGPGEMVVSPALADLLSSPEGALLGERLPGRITGTIGDEGLLDPGELAYVAGSDALDETDRAYRIDRFDQVGEPEPLDAVLLLLVVVVCVVLLFPVGVFIATAVRFGGERRDRRLAALRLVGADARMVRRIAAGESAVGALLGLAAGVALFLPARQLVGMVEVFDIAVFPADVRPSAPLAALILLAVPVSAVVVTLLALRGVAIEPLGVVRNAGVRRRRLWWRLVPPALGLLLLLPLVGGIDPDQSSIDAYRIATGVVLLLAGVTALLPWLVEAVVRRMRGGPLLPLQLAVRRLQLDSGPAARAVSGIAVAVAGAIAVQMLFSGTGAMYTEETGQDPGRAQVRVMAEARDGDDVRELTGRLAATPGVRRALGMAVGYAPPIGAHPDASHTPITVADCATLEELARLGPCADGDVFLVPAGEGEDSPGARRGASLNLNPPRYTDPAQNEPVQVGDPVPWTVPRDARTVPSRPDPMGQRVGGVLATPGAIDVSRMPEPKAEILLRIDPAVPDAVEHVRNTAEAGTPWVQVMELRSRDRAKEFVTIQRALYAGAAGVLLLIGASMVVSTLEQLRERRRLLSVLVAFGTRRSTLSWSVLWQTALPVLLGLALAVAGGIGLGAVLMAMVSTPVAVDWASLGIMTGIGGAVILLVTGLSLPPLWRMMRPDGLRTE